MMISALVKELKKGDRMAQKRLYETYAPRMFAVCRRYVPNEQDAEDVMINGFFKIMTKMDQYQSTGSFEGWMRRIMVTESLMFLRKYKKFQGTLEISEARQLESDADILGALSVKEIFTYIEQLPIGYRTVFNLYCIEGYKHREIAEELGISINTSKSQLILARKKLVKLIEQGKQSIKKNERERLG